MEPKDNESFVEDNRDPLIHFLNQVLVYTIKVLAVLMVLMIIWGLFEVIVELFYLTFSERIHIENLVPAFGSVLAILIALEIYMNIIFYLKRDAIHVPLVLATAVTAIARKVIVLDYTATSPEYIYGIAAVMFAAGIAYWLITKKSD